MKNYILIFIALMLNSCTCKQVNLNENEKQWLDPYKKGDLLIFKSNKGNIDSIVVAKKEKFYTNENCDWFTIGNTQNEGINIDLKPKKCYNEYYCEGEISIVKSNVVDETAPFFRVFGLEFSKNIDKLIMEKVKLSTTSKIFNSAYLFKDGLNAENYGNNYLKSFNWDKEEGLIRYESADGEIFEIIK